MPNFITLLQVVLWAEQEWKNQNKEGGGGLRRRRRRKRTTNTKKKSLAPTKNTNDYNRCLCSFIAWSLIMPITELLLLHHWSDVLIGLIVTNVTDYATPEFCKCWDVFW